MHGETVRNMSGETRYIPYDPKSLTVPEFYEKVKKVFREPEDKIIWYEKNMSRRVLPRDGGLLFNTLHGDRLSETVGRPLIYNSTALAYTKFGLRTHTSEFDIDCPMKLYLQKAGEARELTSVSKYIKLQLIRTLENSRILALKLMERDGSRTFELEKFTSPIYPEAELYTVPETEKVVIAIGAPPDSDVPISFTDSEMQHVDAIFNIRGKINLLRFPSTREGLDRFLIDQATQAFYKGHITKINGTDIFGNPFEIRMNTKYVIFPMVDTDIPLFIEMIMYDHEEVALALDRHATAAAAASSGGRTKSIAPKKKKTTKTSSVSRGRSTQKLSKSPGRGSRSRSSKKKTTKRKKSIH